MRRNYEYKSANDGGDGGMNRVEDRATTDEDGRGERGSGRDGGAKRQDGDPGAAEWDERGIENDAGNPAFAVF